MAMSGRGQRMAENAIASCRPFQNSTGSLKGTRGATRTLGWLESHTDARRIRELLSRAVYVVWSYGTPIGWVSEDEDGGRTAYYVDEQHSVTTSHHQIIAQMGMGEYETIGERRPARRPGRERRVPRPVNQDAVDRANAVVARRRELAGSPGYQNGLTERQQETTLAQLLDPRYANPDWVPGRDVQADLEAELRDIRRIEAEVQERGWRP